MKTMGNKVGNLENKANNVIRNINSNMLIYVVISIMSIFYIIYKSLEKEYPIAVICLLLFGFIVLDLLFFIIMKKMYKNLKLENIFLLLSVFFGLFYIVGFPPSQLPDDTPDYLRTLEVSKLQLTTPQKNEKVGRNLSENIGKVYSSKKYSDLKRIKDLKLNNNLRFYGYANKSLYAFVCYIPQALGVGLARILNFPILIQIIFGKVFNYLLYIILIYLSIKYIPIKKELILFISLLPMSLQEATSLSPDSLIISSLIALISFIIYQRTNKNTKMNNRNMILLAVLSVVISLCKIVYLPLVFLIYLIPNNKFKSSKQKYIYCSIVCFISIVLNLYWLSISSSYLVAFHGRSNSSLQLKYILSNPIGYIIILYRTIDYYILIYLEEMVGCSLGQFVVGTSPIMVLISIIILFMLLIGRLKKGKTIFNILEKTYIAVLLIGTVLLMFTSLYMQWTGYKASMVDGVQGRYFIPLLTIFSMLFSKEQEKEYGKKLTYFIFFMNIMSVLAIFNTYI